MQRVKLIGKTESNIEGVETSEELIAYAARVSNPENQMNTETAPKLLKYLAKHSHWSPFEMVSVVMEIQTTRDIARQILRHRSFSFQEFSQRYAEVTSFEGRECRLQDTKNRQNSLDVKNNSGLTEWWDRVQEQHIHDSEVFYKLALEKGIAKEQARAVLPEGLTMSTLYMSGTLRSWIHYCDLRMANGTQKEHQEIAKECWKVILENYPSLKEVLNNEN